VPYELHIFLHIFLHISSTSSEHRRRPICDTGPHRVGAPSRQHERVRPKGRFRDFTAVPGRCQNAGMGEGKHNSQDDPSNGAVIGRRAFFGRALLAAGAAAALMGLTGCPGGEDDDDGDDGDDD
jgi:hypothetical protein